MKRIICVLLAAVIVLNLSGCNKAKDAQSALVDVSDYLSKSLTAEDLKKGGKLKNISISPDCIISQPKEINSIREFNWSSPKQPDNNEFVKQFKQTYEYLFGNGFEESCFYVDSEHSHVQYNDSGEKISDLKRVSELEKQIKSNEEFVFTLIYDDAISSKKERSFMLYQSPLYCGGMSSFNRGGLDSLLHPNESRRRLELSYPKAELKPSNSFQPESDETVFISGVNKPVSELVRTYEDYVNSLPVFEDTNVTTQVISASSYLLPDGKNYCVGFETSANYKGIMFDSPDSGKVPTDYTFISGFGGMVTPDKVDSAYGIFRCFNISDEKEYDKMLPADKALEKVSSELTAEVVFELRQVNLVYTMTAPSSYEREKDVRKCAAEWKFTLYNKNDKHLYYCYVNACDGESFHYYAAPAPEESKEAEL